MVTLFFVRREISPILERTAVIGIWHVGIFTQMQEWVFCKPLADLGMMRALFVLFNGSEDDRARNISGACFLVPWALGGNHYFAPNDSAPSLILRSI